MRLGRANARAVATRLVRSLGRRYPLVSRRTRHPNRAALQRGSTRLAALVGDEHVLDGAENFLLSIARQRAHAIEDRLGLADR